MNYRIVIYIWVVGFCFLFCTDAKAQETIRIVEDWGTPYPNQPIEVVGKELDGNPFLDKNRVLGDAKWLSKLTLLIKNVSKKNIISFNIDLLIKKEGKILMGIPIYFRTYDNPSDTNSLTLQGEKKIGALKPGEVVKVSVMNEVMSKFVDTLRKNEIENIERTTLDIRAVYFDDLSRWMYGQESRPDPINPGKRIRMGTSSRSTKQINFDWMTFFCRTK